MSRCRCTGEGRGTARFGRGSSLKIPLSCPPAEPAYRLMKRAGEGASAQIVVGVRLLINEIRNGSRDLIVDFPVLLLVELGKDADLGDKEVGVRDAVLVQILGQAGAVLDCEAAQGRAAREERFDLGRDIGLQATEQRLRQAGFELERLHESHAFNGKSPRRLRYTACHENTNREIPEPTTPKPLAGKNRCRDSGGPGNFVRLCYRRETATRCRKSMQRTREGAAADERARLGMFGEKLRQRGGDVLEDLARIVVSERRQDAHVRDEELVVVAAARAMVGNV